MQATVFAVEDDAVEVCWRHAPADDVVVSDGRRTIAGRGRAGAVLLQGLEPGTHIEIELRSAKAVRRVGATTLVPPPGRRLCRFAAFNDMHVGARSFGTWRPVWDDDPTEPHPLRCFRAALAEAVAWGAEAIVIKGDATQRGRAHEWEEAAQAVASYGLPTVWIEGNHETKQESVDGRPILARHGLHLTTGTSSALDLPGVRLIATPTARWGAGNGFIEERVRRSSLALAAGAPAAAVVILHHYPQRFAFPTLYPAGIPAASAVPFLDGLAAANPASLVLAGHSHRHRRHQHGPLVVAETGSTKDYPGGWAGYTVHSGGIQQVIRRTADPRVVAWTERGRRVAAGAWGLWAPGRRDHRCFSHSWPAR